jgi:asparagine synthetase B (glutamine-hydrolysing)
MQNNFNTKIRKLQPILEMGQYDHSEIFGIYTYGIFSEKGENHIHRDVLGNYPLFIGYNKNLTAISSNPYLVAQAIYGNDFLNHKNVMAVANIIASGEIANNQTTFSDVYKVPQNSGIKIDVKNFVSFYSLVDDMYYPMSDSEWNARLYRESEKMVQFLKYYIKTAPLVGGHITGGFDSRVLLSLSLQAGITKDVVYTVRGSPDHPDVIIAKQIAEHFGLNLIVQDVTPPKDTNDEIIKSSFEKTLTNFSDTAGTNVFTERWMVQILGEIATKLKQNNAPLPRTLLQAAVLKCFVAIIPCILLTTALQICK